MNSLPILYLIILLLIGILMPIMGVVNGPKVRQLLETNPERRISVYVQTIAMLVFLGGLVLLAMWFNQQPIETIGAGFLKDAISLSTLLALCLGFLLVLNLFKPHANLLKNLNQRYQQVMYLLPENAKEYKASIVMAFAAGFSEEIVFRGFLYQLSTQFLPIIPAVLLVNVIFGLCHWGTGPKNATWSVILGISWSIIYVWTGSLWIPVLTHVMLDLMSTTLGFKIKQQRKDELSGPAETINQYL